MEKSHLARLKEDLLGMPDFGKATLRLFGSVARSERLLLQEFRVRPRSPLTRKSKLEIVRDTGIVVMAARGSKGRRYTLEIPFKAKIRPGSLLIMGTNRQLDEFEGYSGRR